MSYRLLFPCTHLLSTAPPSSLNSVIGSSWSECCAAVAVCSTTRSLRPLASHLHRHDILPFSLSHHKYDCTIHCLAAMVTYFLTGCQTVVVFASMQPTGPYSHACPPNVRVCRRRPVCTALLLMNWFFTLQSFKRHDRHVRNSCYLLRNGIRG